MAQFTIDPKDSLNKFNDVFKKNINYKEFI